MSRTSRNISTPNEDCGLTASQPPPLYGAADTHTVCWGIPHDAADTIDRKPDTDAHRLLAGGSRAARRFIVRGVASFFAGGLVALVVSPSVCPHPLRCVRVFLLRRAPALPGAGPSSVPLRGAF